MKNKLYLAYIFAGLLIVWPIISYFVPNLINVNLYNIFFISSLSLAIYSTIRGYSFTEQTNACWLSLGLMFMFALREFSLLLSTIIIMIAGINLTENALLYTLFFCYAPALILFSIMSFYGVVKLYEHEIVSHFVAKLLKKMITRTNPNMVKTKHRNGDSKLNSYNLTVDPEDY